MASISFPTNPTNGDTYTYNGVTYEFNSAKSQWIIQVGTSLADVNINGIGGNMVPSANVTYDLGTADNAWRDLYLSSNTIHLGTTQLSVAADGSLQTTSNGEVVAIGGGGSGITSYADEDALPANSEFSIGDLIYLESNETIYTWKGTEWGKLAIATGTPYYVAPTIDYLLVAGGGSGGSTGGADHRGGAGGAGGLIETTGIVVSGTMSVVVGVGGERVSGGSSGNNGSNTTLQFANSTIITAIGGGAGGGGASVGRDGGSGGGGGANSSAAGSAQYVGGTGLQPIWWSK
jgi:hypothetical protein